MGRVLQALYDRLNTLSGLPLVTSSPRPNISREAIAAFTSAIEAGTLSESQRLIVLRPPTLDSLEALGSLGYNHGPYSAYNFTDPDGHNTASAKEYQSNILGCSPEVLSVNYGTGKTLPGNADIPCFTVNALMGSPDDKCEPKRGWTDPQGSQWPSGSGLPSGPAGADVLLQGA